jgi:hypothetical protein
MQSYRDFKYKGNKSGVLTVESITPQFFGKKE